MYIIIFGKSETCKGINISNLGKNGDDLLIKINSVYKTQPNTLKASSDYKKELVESFEPKLVINLQAYKAEDFINGEAKSGRIAGVPNRVISKETFYGKVNEVIGLRYLGGLLENFGLEENVDFKLLAEESWNDYGIGLTRRVTIPDEVIIDNDGYVGLIKKVKEIISIGYAVLHKIENLNVMYFMRILDEDYDLIKDDPNVLIE